MAPLTVALLSPVLVPLPMSAGPAVPGLPILNSLVLHAERPQAEECLGWDLEEGRLK